MIKCVVTQDKYKKFLIVAERGLLIKNKPFILLVDCQFSIVFHPSIKIKKTAKSSQLEDYF